MPFQQFAHTEVWVCGNRWVGSHCWVGASTVKASLLSRCSWHCKIPQVLCMSPGLSMPHSHSLHHGLEPPRTFPSSLRALFKFTLLPQALTTLASTERILLAGREADLHLRSKESGRPAQLRLSSMEDTGNSKLNLGRPGLEWGAKEWSPQRCPRPCLRTCEYVTFHGKGWLRLLMQKVCWLWDQGGLSWIVGVGPIWSHGSLKVEEERERDAMWAGLDLLLLALKMEEGKREEPLEVGKTKSRFFLRASEMKAALLTHWSWPCETHVGLVTYRTVIH